MFRHAKLICMQNLEKKNIGKRLKVSYRKHDEHWNTNITKRNLKYWVRKRLPLLKSEDEYGVENVCLN